MCKIAVIPHIKQHKTKEAWQFAKAITPWLTANDKDGFGYMALGKTGMFGERWLKPKSAWKDRTGAIGGNSETKRVLEYDEALIADPVYNTFGNLQDQISCIALHARMATCAIDLLNVHPFVDHKYQTGIIHNGVITNHADFKKTLSTCDSEAVLTQYVDHNVTHFPASIIDATKLLAGWYAVAALSKDHNGGWYLDIFKESRSALSAVYVNELETLVFATNPEHVKQACATLKWSIGGIYQVEDNTFIRHCATTGKILMQVKLEPAPLDFSRSYPASDFSYTDDSLATASYPEEDLDDEEQDLVDIMSETKRYKRRA